MISTMIFLEIRVYVAPFFVYNSPCISKQEPANQTRLASVTHYVEIFVEKVEFEIRFMHKRVKEKNMLLMISKI